MEEILSKKKKLQVLAIYLQNFFHHNELSIDKIFTTIGNVSRNRI